MLCLLPAPVVRRISADVGFATFVLEIDLRLIQGSAEEIISTKFHTSSRRRANAQPIKSQRVAAGYPIVCPEW